MQRKTAAAFDFQSVEPERLDALLMGLLSHDGPGHTAFCMSLGGHGGRHGCNTAPIGWRAHPAFQASLLRLLGSGAVTRTGAYYWLRRPAQPAMVDVSRGVVQR